LQRDQMGRRVQVPRCLSELGCDLTQNGALPDAGVQLDRGGRLGIGWAWWEWRENRGCGIRDAQGETVNEPALRHLARPYVIAAPGGVRPGRGDGVQGSLTIRVDAGHADQPVVIGWSALTLPAPVGRGTCLAGSQWDATRGRLTLLLDPGVGCELTVRTT